MKLIYKYCTLSAGFFILSACASTPALEGQSANFGDAVQANKAAHAVAPTPEQKANTYIPADSARRALARKRYREDNVEELQKTGTQN